MNLAPESCLLDEMVASCGSRTQRLARTWSNWEEILVKSNGLATSSRAASSEQKAVSSASLIKGCFLAVVGEHYGENICYGEARWRTKRPCWRNYW